MQIQFSVVFHTAIVFINFPNLYLKIALKKHVFSAIDAQTNSKFS